jgi:HEAT repeats
MGILDFLGGKKTDSPVRKHAERVANKRAQAFDRWEAIAALSRMHTADAVEALLPRFTFYVEPSITDQEEKDAAFGGVLEAGQAAVEPVTAFLRKTDSIAWPVKMLDKLVPEEVVIGRLIELLDRMDIEYERDPDRKIQVLTNLGERRDARIAPAAARFMLDANETARFTAVGTVLAQQDAPAFVAALVQCLCQEDSVRVRNRVLEALSGLGAGVAPHQDAVKTRLTPGYSLDGAGVVRKKA